MRLKLRGVVIAGLGLVIAVRSYVASRESTVPQSTAHWQPEILPHEQTVPQTLLPTAAPDRSTALEHYVPVETVVDWRLLHAALSDTPVTDEDYAKFAGILSYEYRSASDAFSQQRIFAPLKATMQAKLQTFKGNRYVRLTQPVYLDHYDLTTHTFPLTPSLGSSVDWLYGGRLAYTGQTDNYVVRLRNAHDFSKLDVRDDATAQAFETRTVPQRTGQGEVYVFIQDVELPKRVTYMATYNLHAEVVKTRLYDSQHRLIAELPQQE